MNNIVEINNLSFSYRPSKKAVVEALKSVALQVKSKKITGLLGPNGSGKSTLFKIISTQIRDHSGEVKVAGLDLMKHAAEIRKVLGVTFQSPSLDNHLTIFENLFTFGSLLGIGASDLELQIEKRLRKFRLWDRRNERVKTLSGGLARRVEVAKSLLGNPKLLLLDEPTAALDPQSRVELWEELRNLCAVEGITILVTTHLMEEAELCDELLFMSEGRCVGGGSVENLKTSYKREIVEVGFVEETLARKFAESLAGADGAIRTGRKVRWVCDDSRVRLAEVEKSFPDSLDFVSRGRASLADIYFENTGRPLL